MGFTVFSIEANMPEAYRLSDYVLNGKGHPKQLLKDMYFWTWDTEEVLGMIEWMREFNRSGKGRIEFTGFDMQTPTVAMENVRAFVEVYDSAYLGILNPVYDEVHHAQSAGQSWQAFGVATATLPVTEELARNCQRVLQHLRASRSILVPGLSAKDVDWAIQNARLVLQYAQLKAHEKSRDASMADNVKWIAEQSTKAKLVRWAHNGHVAYNYPVVSMGRYLHSMFGGDYINFGVAFNEGSFRAGEQGNGLREFTVGPLPEGSLDRMLSSAGNAVMGLDLRQLSKQGPVAEWFKQPHASRSIGSMYADSHAAAFIIDIPAQEMYDAMLFVEKTSAARGNQ
jgi:erythromycin esterase